ncbi:hypothetical protein ACVNSY_13160 [Bacillus sp. OHL2]
MTTIVFAVVLGTGLGVFALSLSQDGTQNPSGGDISVSASGNQSSMKAGGDAPPADTADESKENKDEKAPLAVFQPMSYRLESFPLKKEQMN